MAMASQIPERPKAAATASLSRAARAEQPRDCGPDGGVGGPRDRAGDQAQQRREQQQRQVTEQPEELRLPRRRQRDEVERAFGAHEQADDRVKESDETHDPGRDLTGVVQVLEQPSQHGVQSGVALGHLCRHRHRGGLDREAAEGLEDPERHHQQRHQREHGVVGERRRLQPEPVRPDPPHAR